MKTKFAALIFTIAANGALAETGTDSPMISELCGAGHINEVASQADIQANPDGYFIRGLNIQLSHGDPRIIQAVGNEFHLCTRSAATPEMPETMAILMVEERDVKYLFVPACPSASKPGV